MKTYVLTISKIFPATHSWKGEPTNFWPRIQSGEKKHTIRKNYELWKKRIDEVNEGKAIISLRQWMGKPYNSSQLELRKFTKGEIGIQMLISSCKGFHTDEFLDIIPEYLLAENDGLSLTDFKEWFKKVGRDNQELAIIHFTDFRY